MSWFKPKPCDLALLTVGRVRMVVLAGLANTSKLREEKKKDQRRRKQSRWLAGRGRIWVEANRARRSAYLKDWQRDHYESRREYLNVKQREYRAKQKAAKCATAR